MTAGQKWLQLAVDIVSYEMQHTDDGQLLSQAADRWIAAYPVAARGCIVSVGVLLTLHLANLIDPRYDPISTRFFLWKAIRLRLAPKP